MKQTLLFDLDDTLIHCNRFFNQARSEFLAAMGLYFQEHGIDLQLVETTQSRIDLSGIEQHGLGKHRFPESLVSTYRLMCDKFGRTASSEEEDALAAIGYGVYTRPIEIYPNVHETLEHLQREGHELYLYTGGDLEIQSNKVVNAGLEAFFPAHRRFISEHKNRSVLAQILRDNAFQPAHTWMIGNSARNDIRPALEEGIHAIYLPDVGGWAADHADLNVPVQGRFHTLETLREVPPIIRAHVEEWQRKEGNAS